MWTDLSCGSSTSTSTCTTATATAITTATATTTTTFVFLCLTSLFYLSSLQMTLGLLKVSKENLHGLLVSDFYRPDTLPVTQPTASTHWMDQTENTHCTENIHCTCSMWHSGISESSLRHFPLSYCRTTRCMTAGNSRAVRWRRTAGSGCIVMTYCCTWTYSDTVQ